MTLRSHAVASQNQIVTLLSQVRGSVVSPNVEARAPRDTMSVVRQVAVSMELSTGGIILFVPPIFFSINYSLAFPFVGVCLVRYLSAQISSLLDHDAAVRTTYLRVFFPS